jgi:hypothetical protein
MSISNRAWYAVRVRSRRELDIAGLLVEKGYDAYVPVFHAPMRARPVVLFDGYVFCKFDIHDKGTPPVVTTPGVLRLVGSRKGPEVIGDQTIDSLRKLVDTAVSVDCHPGIAPGVLVSVTAGPLKGVVGTVVRANGRRQLHVAVKPLNQSIVVSISRARIQFVRIRPGTSGVSSPTLRGASGFVEKQ